MEYRKYALRFGTALAVAFLTAVAAMGVNELKVVAYKTTLVALAVALAELVWVSFFKPFYGKTEELPFEQRKDILVFRGILYAAIILALTLGL
jgi:hypothetical protein